MDIQHMSKPVMSKRSPNKSQLAAQTQIDIKIDDFDRIVYKGVPLEIRPQNILNLVNNEDKALKEILDDAYEDIRDEIRDEMLSKILLNSA
jgi:hypothetical protein